ncbi:MAG: hypothetical protein KF862_24770 [Chitinophagaceae bacterium]|nr:hypothetical protein [Chitinophagaceae bacterium]
MTNSFIDHFLEKLNENNIRYVHWKSNTNIDAALANKDDLDILIHPGDRETAEHIFGELKIIRAVSAKDKWQDHIYHYYGMDIEAGELVHIHVHYALVLGYDYDKNFNLPLVDAYLSGAVKYKNVFLPEPEKEYIILVIRLLLKNGRIPFLLLPPHRQLKRLLFNPNVITGGGWRELEDLRSRSKQSRIKEIIENEFKICSYEEFLSFESVLIKNKGVSVFLRASKKLESKIQPFSKNNFGKSLAVSFSRMYGLKAKKLLAKISGKKEKEKKISTGGKIIAFVGGDGAGKSTNVDALYKAVSRHLYCKKIHFGTPKHGFPGLIMKGISVFFSLLSLKDRSQMFFLYGRTLDRKRTYELARKIRRNGGVVIQDRKHSAEITAMDCPRIHLLASGRFTYFSDKEKKIYAAMEDVDVTFVLKLNPSIALQRRPEDNPEELLIRSGQVWSGEWQEKDTYVINTGENDRETVRKTILTETWNKLSGESCA